MHLLREIRVRLSHSYICNLITTVCRRPAFPVVLCIRFVHGLTHRVGIRIPPASRKSWSSRYVEYTHGLAQQTRDA